jgi:bifunctional non-homologous end joining protein LigD
MSRGTLCPEAAAVATPKPLKEYQAKRNFRRTPEPASEKGKPHRKPIFVIQEHHARRLHYDFRLEADGVLKSWAVPKQPSLDPRQKRLAVRVEDHPLAYANFSGTIPEGQYGAGVVHIWDHGTYDNLLAERAQPQTISEGIDAGRVDFVLHGEKLRGRFTLVRMRGRSSGGKENWLLIKGKDEFAQEGEADGKGTRTPRRRAAGVSRPVGQARAAGKAKRTGGAAKPPAEGVAVTNPDKVWFPDAGVTKGDVFRFYERVADRLLPFLRDRPVTLERLPEGVGPGKPHFWQKHTPAYYPAWVLRVELPSERGKPVEYVLVNDPPALLYLVNQGALTFHPWLSRLGDLDRPDFVLFDLDPGPAPFADAVAVARALHKELENQGHESLLKTSGKTGLHVLVPWRSRGGFDEARDWAAGVARRVAEALPDKATVEARKAKRDKRVYIDVLQNARGHHAVPPYVVRAVPQASVSTPLEWRELTPALDPKRYTVKTLLGRLSRLKRDPLAALAL